MFKRLHDRKDFKDSEIGLAIVRMLLDKLNGSVQIKSVWGKGSTFVL